MQLDFMSIGLIPPQVHLVTHPTIRNHNLFSKNISLKVEYYMNINTSRIVFTAVFTSKIMNIFFIYFCPKQQKFKHGTCYSCLKGVLFNASFRHDKIQLSNFHLVKIGLCHLLFYWTKIPPEMTLS